MGNKLLLLFSGLVLFTVSFSYGYTIRKNKLAAIEAQVVGHAQEFFEDNLGIELAAKALDNIKGCDALVGFQLYLYKVTSEYNRRPGLTSFDDIITAPPIGPSMKKLFETCDKQSSTHHDKFESLYMRLFKMDATYDLLSSSIDDYEECCGDFFGKYILRCKNPRIFRNHGLDSLVKYHY